MRRRFATMSMIACVLAALGFLAAPAALAAGEVAIVGTITTPDGAPAAGVVVTAKADALLLKVEQFARKALLRRRLG